MFGSGSCPAVDTSSSTHKQQLTNQSQGRRGGFQHHKDMASDSTLLASQLETLASSVPQDLAENLPLRTRFLEAATKLIPELETPRDTSQRLLYGPCELTGAKIGVDLGIFALLVSTDKALTTSHLAEKTGANADLLRRLLRYMASISLIRETGPDTWSASSISRNLAHQGVAAGVHHHFENVSAAWLALPDWLRERHYAPPPSRTDTSFAAARGEPLFPYFEKHARLEREFNVFMTFHRTGHRTWLDKFDLDDLLPPHRWSASEAAPVRTFVDVGGGLGQVSRLLRSKHPSPSSSDLGSDVEVDIILQDLPSVLAQAELADLPADIEKMHIDFFKDQPLHGADAYYLRSVLRDWPDDSCAMILGHIKRVMDRRSRVLIDEVVVPDVGAHKTEAQADMTMLAMGNAEVRTEARWRGLLEGLGFAVEDVLYYEEEGRGGGREGVVVARLE